MRSKPTIVLFVIVMTAILLPAPAPGNSTEAVEMKAQLEALVDEYIACCEKKSALTSSRSEKIGVISVGAAFQPRLNDYSFRATSFRGWKATPTSC